MTLGTGMQRQEQRISTQGPGSHLRSDGNDPYRKTHATILKRDLVIQIPANFLVGLRYLT